MQACQCRPWMLHSAIGGGMGVGWMWGEEQSQSLCSTIEASYHCTPTTIVANQVTYLAVSAQHASVAQGLCYIHMAELLHPINTACTTYCPMWLYRCEAGVLRFKASALCPSTHLTATQKEIVSHNVVIFGSTHIPGSRRECCGWGTAFRPLPLIL